MRENCPVTPRRWRPPTGAIALAALLAAAGATHFGQPGFYTPIVPRQLGDPLAWVYLSGVAELGCAAALLPSRSRRAAGWVTAALFVVVFPANIKMALDAGGGSSLYRAAVYARLPLQIPLIWWAVMVARQAPQIRSTSAYAAPPDNRA